MEIDNQENFRELIGFKVDFAILATRCGSRAKIWEGGL